MFDLEINNPDSFLKILKIRMFSRFDEVSRLTTEIHFDGWENEVDKQSKFVEIAKC
jgi:hypothetical protein